MEEGDRDIVFVKKQLLISFCFAGVIFENMPKTGELPAHVIYKIRQNTSFTPSTKFVRDRYWTPGPGPWTYQYYHFGFVWIQVG